MLSNLFQRKLYNYIFEKNAFYCNSSLKYVKSFEKKPYN